MTDFVLILVTGLGLGALYFLAASGLSIIYGLMGVLNFAHGAFMMAGSYAGWLTMSNLPSNLSVALRLVIAVVVAIVVGAVIGLLVEVILIRPLYRHHIQQVLVTVGLSLASIAAAQGIWGADPRTIEKPEWMARTTILFGARLPNDRFLFIAVAAAVFLGLLALLRYTRLGLIIRAGVENRTMVEALGINVHRTFTVVFALGGAAAALAGMLYSSYAGTVSPAQGAVAADLRVHRRGHRRDGVVHGHRSRSHGRRTGPAAGQLLCGQRRGRPVRGAAAGPGPPAPSPSLEGGPRMRPATLVKAVPAVVVLAVLGLPPVRPFELPGLLPDRVNGPGSLQLLATCLIVAGIALSYDVLFGRTGLLSFGHALFVAAGSYFLTISLGDWALPLRLAVVVALRSDHAAGAGRRRRSLSGSAESRSPW